MKASTMRLRVGLGMSLLISASSVTAKREMITIQSDQGKKLTIPKSLINAPALLAWFNKNNYSLHDIKGFLPFDLELQMIKEEQAKQKALSCKIRMEKEYLQTGRNRQTITQYQDVGFSIEQLMHHNLLKPSSSRRTISLHNNVIKINMLSIPNQLINSIKGLENIKNLTDYTYIDLSENRIDGLCFETLQRIHDKLYFPLTIELNGNRLKMTPQIKEQLAAIPMISILI